MAVVGNFYFSIFLRLTWKFLDLESEREGSVCWPNNKIIDNTQIWITSVVSSYAKLKKKELTEQTNQHMAP